MFQNQLGLYWEGTMSTGLAYSAKEIYVSNLQQVFALRAKTFLKLNHASTLSIWTEENIYPSQPEERTSKQHYTVTLFDCNHFWHT